MQRDDDEQSVLVARIDHHVDQLTTQYRRFQRLADEVEDWAIRWSPEALERRLETACTIDIREKTLVALVLQATGRAEAVIDAYRPVDGDDHELFYRVVCIERKRYNRPDELRTAA